MQDNNSQAIDTQALNLARAIALQESSGGTGKPNYNAVGDNGTSHGAYQWQPGNFASAAKSYGLDPNDFSPTNQDKVAYAQVKAWKDKGYQPAEIASMWNSGSPHNWQNHSGTTTINGKPIHYDTPAYVNNVKKYYQDLNGEQQTVEYKPQYQEDTQNQLSTDNTLTATSLGSQLGNRLQDVNTAITEAQQGKQNYGSAALQSAGALGGAIGDVVNKGLEKTPIIGTGIKYLQSYLGDKASDYFATEDGKRVSQSINQFQTDHPELSKDIGAGFNIVTALPVLRAIGVAKDVALDATSIALKNVAEKSVAKDLTSTIAKSQGGRQLLNTSPKAVDTLVKERALPDIVDGKYVTKNAYDQLGEEISNIENNQLQTALAKVSTEAIAQRENIDALRQEAINTIRKELKSTGGVQNAIKNVNNIFDDYKISYGDYVTLQDINDMKRGIRGSVNFASPKLESDISYHLGQVFQKNIEEQAKKLGLPDIAKINQQMAELIKSQNALKYLDGKNVNLGTVGSLLKTGGAAAGEFLGSKTGIPFAGAYGGYKGGSLLAKVAPKNIRNEILNRTGKNATKTSVKDSIKKVSKGILYNLANEQRQKVASQ